nr:MAG TPA: hypothetical protein [Crassvirales sp.]
MDMTLDKMNGISTGVLSQDSVGIQNSPVNTNTVTLYNLDDKTTASNQTIP